MLSNVAQDSVTSVASTFHIVSFQRKPKTLGRGITLMHSQVTPPHSTVIP